MFELRIDNLIKASDLLQQATVTQGKLTECTVQTSITGADK
jgi:hypothetical protein